MLIILTILLCVLALLTVAYPLLARAKPQRMVPASATETLTELLARRETAFQVLRELEFDHQVGKITEEDFAIFAAHLKRAAANALKALDEWEASVERELGPTVAQEVMARRALQRGWPRPCPACGNLAAPEDRFCAACGTSLPPLVLPTESSLTCPHCGRSYAPGDHFCSGCGRPLPSQPARI